MDERLKAILGIIAILAGFVLLPVVVHVIDRYYVTSQRLPFNAAGWRRGSWDDEQPRTRQRMANDLVARKRLDGMTRREVQEMLGLGDHTEHWKDWHLRYRLGRAGYLSFLDWDWLVIRFGADGRVEAYQVVED